MIISLTPSNLLPFCLCKATSCKLQCFIISRFWWSTGTIHSRCFCLATLLLHTTVLYFNPCQVLFECILISTNPLRILLRLLRHSMHNTLQSALFLLIHVHKSSIQSTIYKYLRRTNRLRLTCKQNCLFNSCSEAKIISAETNEQDVFKYRNTEIQIQKTNTKHTIDT